MHLRYLKSTIVVSVDSKRVAKNKWEVFVDKEEKRTGLNVVEWIKYSEIRNWRIHLNSIDKDGTEEGFDISLINKVNKICKVTCNWWGNGVFETFRSNYKIKKHRWFMYFICISL